jgi:4-hydroxybenzoyl-CoA thioesterase
VQAIGRYHGATRSKEFPTVAFTSVQKIRFDDVDGAGIVYYPQFFHLCHAAFEDFFDDSAPVSYPEMIRDRRVGFPTVAIESSFLAPLAYGDTAIVELSVLAVGRASLKMGYAIRRKRDGVVSFTAEITTVYIDLDAQKSLPIPDDLRTILERSLPAPAG